MPLTARCKMPRKPPPKAQMPPGKPPPKPCKKPPKPPRTQQKKPPASAPTNKHPLASSNPSCRLRAREGFFHFCGIRSRFIAPFSIARCAFIQRDCCYLIYSRPFEINNLQDAPKAPAGCLSSGDRTKTKNGPLRPVFCSPFDGLRACSASGLNRLLRRIHVAFSCHCAL